MASIALTLDQLTNMKVAELKAELKARGLTQTGNKSDLVMRLQQALMNPMATGDATLDAMLADAIGHDRTNDSTSQDSASNLSGNQLAGLPMNQLPTAPMVIPKPQQLPSSPQRLQSPSSSPTKIATAKPAQPLSVSTANNQAPVTTTTTTKTTVKLGSPTAVNKDDEKKDTSAPTSPSGVRKASEVKTLSESERLALRASKFGVEDKLQARAARFGVQGNKGNKEADKNLPKAVKVLGGSEAKVETDPEVLKKRAERFGTVVSDKLKKVETDERLNKRKERFGAGDTSTSPTQSAGTKRTTPLTAEEEERKRKRMERFGNVS